MAGLNISSWYKRRFKNSYRAHWMSISQRYWFLVRWLDQPSLKASICICIVLNLTFTTISIYFIHDQTNITINKAKNPNWQFQKVWISSHVNLLWSNRYYRCNLLLGPGFLEVLHTWWSRGSWHWNQQSWSLGYCGKIFCRAWNGNYARACGQF